MNPHDTELTAQPDTHYHHAFKNLPTWLLGASAETRGALKNASLQIPDWHASATPRQHARLKSANAEHMTHRNRTEALLNSLKNAQDFAEPILAGALKTRYGLDLDVKATFLRLYIPKKIPLFSIKSGAARIWTVSLLDAALHNFQLSETEADAHESDSAYITKPTPGGQFTTLPAIERKMSIQNFTRLCRELDIGGQYEIYLNDNLGVTNPVAGAILNASVVKTQKAALHAALQMGRLQKTLPDDAFQALLGLVQGRSGVRLDGHLLQGHDVRMMSSSLSAIVVFAPRLDQARATQRIIVYIPDDPEHPIKQYPNARSFMIELSRKLRSRSYQTFFSRFVPHAERTYFFADLNQRLSRAIWHEHTSGDALPSWRDAPLNRPNLQFSITAFNTDLWAHLYKRQLNKILNDARTLAVSTARADCNARWALWEGFCKIAETLAQVALFVAMPFVPFLGEAMLAYMAYQALDEMFEAVVDWTQGQVREGFGHLINIAETAVQLGTFAVGGKLVADAVSHLLPRETLELFGSLKPVDSGSGRTRYWRPDLAPYEQSARLPATATPDQLGLYQHQGSRLLRLENKLYAVEADSATGRYTIEHPVRTDAYRPVLRQNGFGAWQSPLDRPWSWDRETVIRRLGHSVESFSPAEREEILRISGFHENVLREIHVENHRPPSLLTDTIKRYRIDRGIQALIDQADTAHPDYDQALNRRLALFESRYRELQRTDDPQAQLLLGDFPGLPTDIAVELVNNASGTEVSLLHNGSVPQRLKDVAVKAMEAVRVSRAYEGFYFPEMDTVDTHRLALHSVESMPGWPTDLRIEVREFSSDGTLRDSIGEVDAAVHKTLVHAEDFRYRVAEHPEQPGDFYQALLLTLTDQERAALELPANDGPSLKRYIAEHAANKPELRKLFAKNPRRKPFYDPTTMRLPGGTQGYPRDSRPTPTLDDRVREVYPDFDEAAIRAFVEELQRHPDGARMELSRLASEGETLREDLARWVQDAPTTDRETGRPMSALAQQVERHNRRLLAQETERSWRRQSERETDQEGGTAGYALRFTEPVVGDLPTLTADFSHVSTLILEGNHSAQGLPAFLTKFSGLRRLELRRFALNTLPDAIGQMVDLEVLILSDCALNVDAAAWAKLSSMKKIVMLDLFRNPFEIEPNIDSMPALVHLDLSQTGLSKIPAGALQHPGLNTLMLETNTITELPAGWLDSPVNAKRGLNLAQNPLGPEAMEQIKQHYHLTAYDLGVFAPDPDIARARVLYPYMDVDQASAFIYELPGTLLEGRTELTRLEAQLAQLINDLAAWTADIPALHPLTGEPFNAQQLATEQASRDRFRTELEQCWRRERELDDFNDALEPTFELLFETFVYGEMPTLSADFSHVTSLELLSTHGATRIGSFLDAFPNLKSLRLRGCNLGNIPDAVFKMGDLHSLSLPECFVTLSPESTNALAGMEVLDYLDLSLNPLGQTPDLSQMPGLANVLLHETAITQIPRGLFQLKELDWADLSDNAITDIPSDIHELPLEIAQNIMMKGNPFSEESLQHLVDYFERTRVDFGVQEVIDRGELEISTSAGSEIDE
ncbi:hypothetical protein HU727_008100 [Pseudomonas sp. SWRI153]|uniref:Dermonecrotic toxin N-terminal domain-containing protein n=1 Tax=Pseudomonas khorasanensis TaxID=2745508 RepID=A0A923JDU2_9PSED|nr:DUF6543 domain-containing protein [Pseudomonas khorasanensis]MBV4485548.1 hypothetical protein [Pseudomonas khorasanensis]